MTEKEKTEIVEQLNVKPEGEAFDLSELLANIPNSEPQKGEDSEPQKGDSEPVVVSAAMYVSFLDFIVSRGCSLYAKESPDKFKMSGDEKESLETAAAAYFETAPVFVSPAGWFALATVIAVSAPAYLAYTLRKEKDEAAAKIAAAKKAAAKTDESKEGRVVAFSERSTEKRKRFEVDENGLFTYNKQGQYLKVENRNEKASQLVLSLKKDGKTNKEVLAAIAEI